MLARGLKAVVVVVLASICGATLAGAVRAVTLLPPGAATAVGLLLAAGCVAVSWPHRARVSVGTAVWLVASALVAVAAMASFRYGPLVGWVGSDGGIHVSYRDTFATTEPNVYAGFVGFYAFTWCIERLVPTDAYGSFATGVLVVGALVGAGVAWSAARGLAFTGSRRRVAVVSAVLAGALVTLFIALPVVSYYQLDGFFAQLWILLPLAAVWLADASSLSRVRRGILIVVACVAARYTYGLVLGDLGVLALVLVIVEARRAYAAGEPRWPWIVAVLAVLAGVVVLEYRFLVELFAVVTRYGWFVKHDFIASLVGSAIATLGLAIIAALAPSLGRFLVVPLSIIVANTVTIVVVQSLYPGDHYYLFKYDFHALVLLSCASTAAFAFVVGGGLRGARRTVAIGSLVLVAGGLVEVSRALGPMRASFVRRATGLEVNPSAFPMRIGPLVDLVAARRIRHRLLREHAGFGGFLVAWGPEFNFTNAMFGRWNNGYFSYRAVDNSRGHCVFWTHREGERYGLWDMPVWMKRRVKELDGDARSECESYDANGVARDLCSACW